MSAEIITTPTPSDKVFEALSMPDVPSSIDPEDLEEGSVQYHDQLPNVEEVKVADGRNAARTFLFRRVPQFLRCAAVLVLVALVTLGIAMAVINEKSTKSYYKEPLQNDYRKPENTEEVIQFLLEHKVSREPSLRADGDPQQRAVQWLAEEDNYSRSVMHRTPDNTQRYIERFVMATLYFHFHGDEWTYKLNFLKGTDTCNWFTNFYTAGDNEIRAGITCDDDELVTEIALPWNNLAGEGFPEELSKLEKLETLHMYNNEGITGGLPDLIRDIPTLHSLLLQHSGLHGTLPDWIGDLTQLTSLGLGNNKFHGDVPTSIKNLKDLRLLGLDDNDELKGNINELLRSMQKIEFLYLGDNLFSGELDGLIERWPNLLELDVSNNMLDGHVPNALTNHNKLMVADIHKNLFSGQFPDDIFENTNLQFLALHSNNITGTLPDRIAYLSNLRHLDVSSNQLTGTIPDTVGMMVELRYLATAANRFESQFMLNVSKLENLKDLSMKSNNLKGTIPDWIGELTNMELLDLDANNLTGTIPSSIGLLTGLDHLLLNRNKLTGTLPSEMSNMAHLTVFLVDGNSIHGNADAICEAPIANPLVFVSDCYPTEDGTGPELRCLCCTFCCLDDDDGCNDYAWTNNYDPAWEYGYVRPSYHFSLENAPAIYAKDGGENGTIPDPIP